MVDLGEGSGLGGILKGLVLINRYSPGTYLFLLEKAKAVLFLLDFEDCEKTDKAGGLAGLIVTLCRYEEFYKDEKILKLIDRLAQKLSSLKTLEYEGRVLWKTLDHKNHPISGAVHGMTGIAEAFLMADLRLGKKQIHFIRYYSRLLPLQATDHPCFARMSQRKLLMSEAVGGGSCFTGHSCKHDEPGPDCRLAVNRNIYSTLTFTFFDNPFIA